MRNETVSMVVLGDSNVVGVPSDEGSFRTELFAALTADGYDVLPLGQYSDPGGAHEGINGQAYSYFLGTQLARILTDYAPNEPRVIVVWLGTNDMVQGNPVVYPTQGVINAGLFVEQVFAADPLTWMVLCTAPPFAAGGYPPEFPGYILQFNTDLKALVTTKRALGRRVLLCDAFAVLDPGNGSNADLVDGVHLSVSGRTKAADVIHDTVADLFAGVGEGSIFMRGELNAPALNAEGEQVTGAVGTMYEVDGVTPLAATMYAARTGGTTLTNPLTSVAGRFTAYVNVPQRAVLISNGISNPVEFTPDPGESMTALVLAAGDIPHGIAANTGGRTPIGTSFQEMRVNAAGTAFEWYTRPMVRVRRSTNQSIANNTLVAVTFDTESYDTDGMHSTSVNTNRLTIVTPGKYATKAKAVYEASVSGVVAAFLRVNGTITIDFDQRPPAAGVVTSVSASGEYAFAAGDYIEFIAYQTSGGALNLLSVSDYSPVLEAVLVGGA